MEQFRFLIERNNQAYILAGEEALLMSVSMGSSPILRFVIFDPPAILIGYHQAVEQEVNLDEAKKRGLGHWEKTDRRWCYNHGTVAIGMGNLC